MTDKKIIKLNAPYAFEIIYVECACGSSFYIDAERHAENVHCPYCKSPNVIKAYSMLAVPTMREVPEAGYVVEYDIASDISNAN